MRRRAAIFDESCQCDERLRAARHGVREVKLSQRLRSRSNVAIET